MTGAPSVLLADVDPHSREALVNQLLVAGVTEIGVAASPEEVTAELTASDYDVLVVDFELFCDLDGNTILDRYRDEHDSRLILMVDEDRDELLGRAARARDMHVCILKSSARRILRSVVAG